jgi:adenylate cyclase
MSGTGTAMGQRFVGSSVPGRLRPARIGRPYHPSMALTVVLTVVNALGLAAVVFLLVGGTGVVPAEPGRGALLAAMVSYLALAVPALAVLGRRRDRPAREWLSSTLTPSVAEATSALRLPYTAASHTARLWAGAALVTGVVGTVAFPDPWTGLRVAVATALGGVVTSGVVYLLTGRIVAGGITRALAAHPPTAPRALGVAPRLVGTWGLTSGVPLVAVVLVVLAPGGPGRASALLGLAVGSLAMGLLVTALNVRAVSRPLARLREAVELVDRGDRDVRVSVDDAGEIGLLQAGVDRMAQGLAERERLRDLFDRHVGTAVAQRLTAGGSAELGEERVVTALFVDITESTALVSRTGPRAMAELLNEFFRVVVESVEAEGGLVNKFAGDGALCIFGAPLPHPDAAGAALRAARRIRDLVAAAATVDIGIGISTGLVWAGPVGATSRLEYTVIGSPVNEAARLTESAKAEPGRILVSASTVQVAGDEGSHWIPGRDVAIRGREEPLSTWIVGGEPQ